MVQKWNRASVYQGWGNKRGPWAAAAAEAFTRWEVASAGRVEQQTGTQIIETAFSSARVFLMPRPRRAAHNIVCLSVGSPELPPRPPDALPVSKYFNYHNRFVYPLTLCYRIKGLDLSRLINEVISDNLIFPPRLPKITFFLRTVYRPSFWFNRDRLNA